MSQLRWVNVKRDDEAKSKQRWVNVKRDDKAKSKQRWVNVKRDDKVKSKQDESMWNRMTKQRVSKMSHGFFKKKVQGFQGDEGEIVTLPPY